MSSFSPHVYLAAFDFCFLSARLWMLLYTCTLSLKPTDFLCQRFFCASNFLLSTFGAHHWISWSNVCLHFWSFPWNCIKFYPNCVRARILFSINLFMKKMKSGLLANLSDWVAEFPNFITPVLKIQTRGDLHRCLDEFCYVGHISETYLMIQHLLSVKILQHFSFCNCCKRKHCVTKLSSDCDEVMVSCTH